MEAFNAAADWLAGEAFRLKTANKVKLQQLYYRQLREDFGLSAQMAIRCIAQVCEAYSRDKSKRPRFKKYASIPYDQRLMSFKGADRVSLLTIEGRIIVPVIMGKHQSERFNGKHGQCDLVRRKKAALVGVEVIVVDPRNTSKTCPACNYVSRKNRIKRDVFLCDECGYFDHADIVGAKNIRSGALVIAREVSVAAAGRVSRETSSIYNRGASA